MYFVFNTDYCRLLKPAPAYKTNQNKEKRTGKREEGTC